MSAAAASFPSCSGVRTEKTVTLRSHSRSTSATASILCWPCGGPFLLDLWPPHVRSRQARAPLGPRRLRGTAGPDLSPLPGRAPRLGGAPRRLPELREHQAFRHAGGRGLPGVRTRHRRGVTGVPASRTASPSAPDTVGSRRVLILGLAGLAAFSAFFLIRPLFGPDPYGPRPAGTTYAYSFLVVAAFVPYAAAVWAFRRGVSLRVAIAGTILLHGLLLPAALTQSQDLYMYLFYGKMWAVHGANPYLVEPQAFRTDAWFPWVRWPDQPTVYGPLWTMVTAVPAGLASGSLSAAFALAKTVAALLGVASAAGLVAACRGRGEPAGPRLVLLAWNPVILVSLPLGGHADIAVVAGVLWAVVADRRGRPVVATALLTAASLVKAY